MVETILSSSTIASGGGTDSGQCAVSDQTEVATIVIDGFDGNSTNLDVAVTGASSDANGTLRNCPNGDAVTGIDASTDGAVFTLTGLKGLSQLEITVTNNAASSTTVTVKEDTTV